MPFTALSFVSWRALRYAMLSAVVAASTVVAAGATPAAQTAVDFMVTSNGDEPDASPGDALCQAATGACTLRAAIQEANATPGLSTIGFTVPSGHIVIAPVLPLPVITSPVIIDGYTQPGAAENTAAFGSNATICVELLGSRTPGTAPGSGLSFRSGASGSIVRGLAISGWAESQVEIVDARVQVAGNNIGTDRSGTANSPSAPGASQQGVHVTGDGALGSEIGGSAPRDRNVVSGNLAAAVRVSATKAVAVRNNLIGVDVAAAAALGQGLAILVEDSNDNVIRENIVAGRALAGPGPAIVLTGARSFGNVVAANAIGTASASGPPLAAAVGVTLQSGANNNLIGGEAPGEANLIRYDGSAGILVDGAATTGNRILGNRIKGVNGQGIDLAGDGPTADDALDADSGPNGLQNAPRLTEITASGMLRGSLSSAPGRSYRIEISVVAACTNGGGGLSEGVSGRVTVSTGVDGTATFDVALTLPGASGMFTATATDTLTGDTSEFSACLPFFAPQPSASVVLRALEPSAAPRLTEIPLRDIPATRITGLATSVQGAPLSSIAIDPAPLSSIPLSSIPLSSIPLSSIPLSSIPLSSIPLSSIPLSSIPLSSIPLSSIPLSSISPAAAKLATATWADLLRGTSWEGVPLASVTLTDVLTMVNDCDKGTRTTVADCAAAAKIKTLTLQNVPLGRTWLSTLSLAALALGALPFGAIDGTARPETLMQLELDATAHASIPEVSVQAILDAAGSASIPLSSIPLSSIPLSSIPLSSIPLSSIPLSSIGVSTVASAGSIGAIPLSSISLGNRGFCELWDSRRGALPDCAALGGTPNQSLAAFIQQLATQTGITDLASTPLSSIPLSSIPLSSIPLSSILFGGTTMSSIPLSSIPLSSIRIDGAPLSSIPLSSIPLSSIPLSSIPLSSIPLSSIPLSSIPLSSIPLSSISVTSIPLSSIPLSSIAIAGTPLSSIPLSSIGVSAGASGCAYLAALTPPLRCATLTLTDQSTLADLLAAAPTLPGLTLRSLKWGEPALAAIPPEELTLDHINLAEAFPGNTAPTLKDLLGDLTLGQITPGSNGILAYLLLGHLPAGTLGQTTLAQLLTARGGNPGVELTLGFLFGGDLTIGEAFELGLGMDGLKLGDLLVALLSAADYQWETLDLEKFIEELPPSGEGVPYSVEILVSEAAPGFATRMAVTLPAGFRYRPGTTTIVRNGSASEARPDPSVAGEFVSWTLPSIEAGAKGSGAATVSFRAYPGLRIGTFGAHATVDAGGIHGESEPTADSFVRVAEVDEPGSDNPPGFPANPDILYVRQLSTRADIDYFRVEAQAEGKRLAVFLGSLGADADLVQYGPPTAETPIIAPSPGAIPLGSKPFEDKGAGLAPGTPPGSESQVEQGPPGTVVVGSSATQGTGPEGLTSLRSSGAGYNVKVTGHNQEADTDRSYTFRVRVTQERPTPLCQARAFPIAAPTTAPPALPAPDPATKTLMVTSRSRLERSYGAADAVSVTNALSTFAHLGSTASTLPFTGERVDGVLLDVDSIPGIAPLFAAWDANPCDWRAASAVTRKIVEVLSRWWGQPGSQLQNVLVVGSDEIIPFARVNDDTEVANEWHYAQDLEDVKGAVFGALATSHLLTDDPYGDRDPKAWLDRFLYVPDYAVGRLLETPPEIVAALEAFGTSNGQLDPKTALVSGYDFLADGAKEVGAALHAGLGITPVSLNGAWTKEQLVAELVKLDGPGALSLNAHYDHFNLMPGDVDADAPAVLQVDRLLTTGDLLQADGRLAIGLKGSISFSMGCHGGLNIADLLFRTVGDPAAMDWAQVYARAGAIYVGNTGFGYGDQVTVALSERLMVRFARNLERGGMSAGQAWKAAKQGYESTLGVYGEYDKKVMMQAAFYGIPNYRIAGVAAAAPQFVGPADIPGPSAHDTVTDSVDFVIVQPIEESLERERPGIFIRTKHGDALRADSASYYTAEGGPPLLVLEAGSQVTHYQPIEPLVAINVTQAPGIIAHGALITSLASIQRADFDPVLAMPTFDQGTGALEPLEPKFNGPYAFPPQLQNITTFSSAAAPGGQSQNLVVMPGEFESPGGPTGTQRVFTSVGVRVYYALPGASFVPPEIQRVTGFTRVGPGGATLTVRALVPDRHGIELQVVPTRRVLALVFDGGAWKPLELTRGPADEWSGTLAVTGSTVEFFVQAADANGNVAVAMNRGFLFDALPAIRYSLPGITRGGP